ncbi:MAG: hypothetical protein K8R88_09955 [Armatimonadetes bacterium]|nr:hypothetical protein [Armatimonadota bacterium]
MLTTLTANIPTLIYELASVTPTVVQVQNLGATTAYVVSNPKGFSESEFLSGTAIAAGAQVDLTLNSPTKVYAYCAGSGSLDVTGSSSSPDASLQLTSSASTNVAILNAALLANSWVVLSTPGTYEFNDSILLPSNSRLTVNAGVTLKLANGTNKYLIRNYGTDGTFGTWSAGNSNITLDIQGWLDFNFVNNTATAGIDANIANWPGFGIHFYNVTEPNIPTIHMIGTTFDSATGAKYALAFTGCTRIRGGYCWVENRSDGIHLIGGNNGFDWDTIEGKTGDDLFSSTPKDYNSYVISGTAAHNSGIHIKKLIQTGSSYAANISGGVYSGTTYTTINTIIDDIYHKPSSSAVSSIKSSIRHLGCKGLSVGKIYAFVPRDVSCVRFDYDSTSGFLDSTIPCTGIVFDDILRRDNTAIAPTGSSFGQIVNMANEYVAKDVTFNKIRSVLFDGYTEGIYTDAVSGVFNLAPGGTSSGSSTQTGYITNLTINDCQLNVVDASGVELVVGSYLGQFINWGRYGCYNGTTYDGVVKINNCVLRGFQSIATTYDNASPSTKWIISNNIFHSCTKGLRFQSPGTASFNNNVFLGTTNRIVELASTNASAAVDVRFAESNYVSNISALPYYSTAGGGAGWTYTMLSYWRPRGRGKIQTVDGNRFGPWDADVFRLTANSAQTLRLRPHAPGDVITIRNDSASGTITLSSVDENGSAQATPGTFTNTAGTTLTNPMTTGQVVTLIATTERSWQQIA